MKILRFSDCSAAVTILARAYADSKREIIREASGLLVTDASNASNMSSFDRNYIGIVFLRITSVCQIETTPSLPKNRQITALAERFQQCGESVLFRRDNAKLRLKQIC